MADASISVEMREGKGKGFNRKLRRTGRVPAVVYGFGHSNVMLSVDPVMLERKIKASHAGINTLFDLEGDPSIAGRKVIVKELQRDPVRGWILHADFFEVDPEQKIHVSVPVHIQGDAPGVVMGGVIEHTLREVEIECLPGAIPDELFADVSALELGDSVHVSDLVLPAGVAMLSDETQPVVSVIVPRGVSEEEEEAAEAAEGEALAEAGEAPAEGEAEGGSEEGGEG